MNFSPEAAKSVEELAAQRGVTPEDIVHDALQLLIWIEEAKKQGYHVLLERQGRVRELSMP
jgi:hypothetical protein